MDPDRKIMQDFVNHYELECKESSSLVPLILDEIQVEPNNDCGYEQLYDKAMIPQADITESFVLPINYHQDQTVYEIYELPNINQSTQVNHDVPMLSIPVTNISELVPDSIQIDILGYINDLPNSRCVSTTAIFPETPTVPDKTTKSKTQRKTTSEWTCARCGRSFKSRTGLVQHNNQLHSSPTPYGCKICGKRFRDFRTLQEHHRRHLITDKPFKCDECPKQFMRQWDLQRHVDLHHGMSQYRCSFCGKAFDRPDHVKDHELSHENGTVKKKVCYKMTLSANFAESPPVPNKSTTSKTRRKTTSEWTCASCGRSFKSRTGLVQHNNQLHSGPTPHGCDICGKRFRDFHTMEEHRRRHLIMDKPFKCDECPKQYMRESDLQRHVDLHHGMSQYCCSICGKAFDRPDHVKDHELSHENGTVKKKRFYKISK